MTDTQPHAALPASPYRPAPAPEEWDPAAQELPRRPRRRLLTAPNLVLLGLTLTAAGFVAGVLVEKGQAGTPATTGRRALATAGSAPSAPGAAASAGGRTPQGAGAGATVGTVATVDGRTLFITDTEGNTIKVTAAPGGTVTRTTVSSLPAVHPGDTVIVSGPRNADGSITATAVRASAAGTGGGVAGLFGRGSAGRAAAGGLSSGAGTPSGGAAAPGGQSLFGSG